MQEGHVSCGCGAEGGESLRTTYLNQLFDKCKEMKDTELKKLLVSMKADGPRIFASRLLP